MPATIIGAYSGDAAEFQRSLAAEPWLILAAVVVIYIVLGVLYESFIHPVTILSTLPSAGIGALLALMFSGNDLSVVALVGIVLLMGIVKKNGILVVDFALEAERERGLSPEAAAIEACLLRFRPIMMTTGGCFAGLAAVGAGSWDRLGIAAPAGDRDRRWPATESGADALHDAGDLCGVRAVETTICCAKASNSLIKSSGIRIRHLSLQFFTASLIALTSLGACSTNRPSPQFRSDAWYLDQLHKIYTPGENGSRFLSEVQKLATSVDIYGLSNRPKACQKCLCPPCL